MDSTSREPLLRFYEKLEKERVSAIVAPTSYGKTVFSPVILERAREAGLSYGLIHVVPFRALVREIYQDKFANFKGKFSIGYQSMDYLEGGVDKSPFFLRDLVATTLDSYAWNVFGIPVAEFDKIVREASLGHGYVAGMSIFTSTVVFDEAHVFIGSGTERAVFTMARASMAYLSQMNVPFAIETATMPSTRLSTIVKDLKDIKDPLRLPLVYVCRSSDCGRSAQASSYRSILGDSFHPVADKEWYDQMVFKWRTHLIKEDKLVEEATGICRSNPLLVIRNTIPTAVETYKKLKERCPQATLIHGWVGAEDRKNKISFIDHMLERGEAGAIVATQVIEAGVEAEAHAIITDIAPIENLAQRIGRLCRRKTEGLCREDGVDVYIIEDGAFKGVYDERLVGATLEKLGKYLSNSAESIDWRLLEDPEDGGVRRYSFTKIMEEVHKEAGVSYGGRIEREALQQALSLDLPSTSMLEILAKTLEKELSETTLVKLVPGKDECNFVVVELGRLLDLLGKKPDVTGKCLGNPGKGELVFRVKTSGGEEDVRVRVWKGMSPIDLTRTIMKEIYYGASRREVSIRDFYIPLEETCYDRETGAFYNAGVR
ncbi:MAG: CRISPR-associated helicase Cas3' [Thermogladius sp.]|jgi:CRISPR-associated endonuclease/helicase Cas3|nr:CRISPR-associated helicase Cas3' [Thermogladius sp.]